MSHQPRILFVTLMNDAGSDRIVAAFARLGAENGVLGHRNSYAAASRFAHHVFPLKFLGNRWWSNLRLGASLHVVVRQWAPDLVVPLDDLAARTLRDPRILKSQHGPAADLIERSLGAAAFREVACNRRLVSEAAGQLGLCVPPHAGAARLDVLETHAAAFGYPVVLKRDHTCGGFGVNVVEDQACLALAFRRAARKAFVKRLLGWVPGFGLSRNDAITIQKYIAGPMAFRIVPFRYGRVLEGVNFLAERTHPGRTGASTMVRQLDSQAMDTATEKLIGALKCSGLVSVDFILGQDGKAYLIELNARPPASGHLGELFGHDIYQALLSSFHPGFPAQPASVAPAPTSIALFPRELDREPAAHFEDMPETYHDVPWDDPGVLERYKTWLLRRHPLHRHRLKALLAPCRDHASPAPGGPRHDATEPEAAYPLTLRAET